jgi:hypothetical protein
MQIVISVDVHIYMCPESRLWTSDVLHNWRQLHVLILVLKSQTPRLMVHFPIDDRICGVLYEYYCILDGHDSKWS